MVSVDGFRYINHHSGIGRSFPRRFHSHFSSLFDDDDVILQNLNKDMKIGSSMLDSVFPFYSSIRPGRYSNYDLSSPPSRVIASDVNDPSELSGNVRVIPIKVEHRPEKYRDQNTTFRLLNGPEKHTATARNPSLLCPGHSFQEFDDISSLDPPAWMTSLSPKGNSKYINTDLDQQLYSPKSYENYKSKADIDGNTFDNSKHRSQLSTVHDYCEEPLENWITVPVKHVESSCNSVSDEELNSNNNSPRKRFSSTSRSRASNKVKFNRENSKDSNIQSQNTRSRKTNPQRTSASSEQYKSRKTNPQHHSSPSSEENLSRETNPPRHSSACSEENQSRETNPRHHTCACSEENQSRKTNPRHHTCSCSEENQSRETNPRHHTCACSEENQSRKTNPRHHTCACSEENQSRKTNPRHHTCACSEENQSRETNLSRHSSASSEENQSRKTNPRHHTCASSEENQRRKTNPRHHTCACSEQNQSRNEEKNTSAIDEDFDMPERDEIVKPPRCQEYYDLKVKLSGEDRKIDYIEGDGNCLFRALSKVIFGSEKYHKAMRTLIVDLIATHRSKFAQFVDDEDVEEHVNRMCEDGCWATTCEIYAAATLVQRDVFMLTPGHRNQNYSWLLFHPVFKTGKAFSLAHFQPCCYITLCNTNGNHYDRVVPEHGGCNCFLPHPELDGLLTDSTSSVDTSSADCVPVKH